MILWQCDGTWLPCKCVSCPLSVPWSLIVPHSGDVMACAFSALALVPHSGDVTSLAVSAVLYYVVFYLCFTPRSTTASIILYLLRPLWSRISVKIGNIV